MKRLLALSVLACGLSIGIVHASILQINQSTGYLTGATGVLVNGGFYDVSFKDGTCISALGGCIPEKLTFQSGAAALAASQALLDQVFLGINMGDPALAGFFDSQPGLTSGCPSGAYTVCMAITPYSFTGLQLLAGVATNYGTASVQTDYASLDSFLAGIDTHSNGIGVFAAWSVASAPVPVELPAVPEPSTFILLLAGLGLVGFLARKKLTY